MWEENPEVDAISRRPLALRTLRPHRALDPSDPE
jgi:hypothetical protein